MYWPPIVGRPEAPRVEAVGCFTKGRPDADIMWSLQGEALYLDESGGEHASTTYCRRSEWGLSMLSPTGAEGQWTMAGGFFGAIDDIANALVVAAPRAIISILERTSGDLVVYADCAYLILSFLGLRVRLYGKHAGIVD